MIAKILYLTLFLVVFLASLAFKGENSESVVLDLVFFSLPQMSLFVLTLGSIATGILIGLLPGIILIPYLRLKIGAMKNRIEMLEVTETE